MLAHPRQHAGQFYPLSTHDFLTLVADTDRREEYLDALSYMHDLVCPYWDHAEPARFDTEDATISLKAVEQRTFGGDSELDLHVQENAERAVSISQRGPGIMDEGSQEREVEIRSEATSFMLGLLRMYNRIRTTYNEP